MLYAVTSGQAERYLVNRPDFKTKKSDLKNYPWDSCLSFNAQDSVSLKDSESNQAKMRHLSWLYIPNGEPLSRKTFHI